MTSHHITATFADGHVAKRRSQYRYSHAARKASGTVTFHSCHGRAVRAAGPGGEVAETVIAGRATYACVVCEDTGTVTYGPSATTGTFNVVACHRCRA